MSFLTAGSMASYLSAGIKRIEKSLVKRSATDIAAPKVKVNGKKAPW
jgi:hypothetical protein